MYRQIAVGLLGLCCLSLQAEDPKELKHQYDGYNTAYFHGKLPKDTLISKRTDPSSYAYTTNKNGVFIITFSKSYNLGQRYDELTLLHEMCHIQEWDEAVKMQLHGPKWRVCMYKLKMAGAFDELIIEAN